MKIEIRDLFNESIYNIEVFKLIDELKYNNLINISGECGYDIEMMEDGIVRLYQKWDESKVINGRDNFLNLLNYINSILF